MFPIAFIPGVGPFEMIVVGIIALLLFGKRLPEVAKSLGKGVVEFKKGLRGIEDDIDVNAHSSRGDSNSRPIHRDESVQTSAPKFEPPTSEPVDSQKSESN